MIELRGTFRNLAKWFRLCERLVDQSPRMERNMDTGAVVVGGPTSTGVLTRGQMARALRDLRAERSFSASSLTTPTMSGYRQTCKGVMASLLLL